MYINKLERRVVDGMSKLEYEEKDSVEIEIEVPLYTIKVQDFYEFMKKYPKTEDNEYSGDGKIPTNMGDCISDYLRTLVDPQQLKSFFAGDFMSTDYLSLHPWRTNLHQKNFSVEFKYQVESEAPF